jgi:hypothetical protein
MIAASLQNNRRLPDFLCVGIEKCGTTSLYELLKQHPAIGLSSHKETHFFNTYWDNGLAWYEEKFSAIPDACLRIGEITPSYHRFPEVIPRIQQTLGKDVKILILLREPRQRAFSHYIHDFANHLEVTDLVYKRYLATTHYARALRNCFDAFGQHKCLVQIFEEDFLPSQQRLVDNVCAFLGIASHPVAPVHSNPSCLPSAIWSPDRDCQILVEGTRLAVPANSMVIYTGNLKNTRILSSIKQEEGKRLIEQVQAAVSFIPELKSSIIYEQNVREELEQVEALTGRNLNVWRKPLPDLHAPVAPLPEFLPA